MAKLNLSCPAPTDREKIWSAIRALQTFTTRDLALKTGLNRGPSDRKIKDYLNSLEKAGIVRVASRQKVTGTFHTYELVRDMGANAPRVSKAGALLPPSGRNRMWQAMRILKNFSTRELAQSASVNGKPVAVSEAESYCKWLARGNYLRSTGPKRWAFIAGRDTGPKAPQILRIKQLYDPNTDKIIYSANAEGRDDT